MPRLALPKTALVLLFAVASFTFAPAPLAHAWRREAWRQEDPTVTYRIQTTGANAVPEWLIPTIESATDTWSSTATPLVVGNFGSAPRDATVATYSLPEAGRLGTGGCYRWDGNTGICDPGQGFVNLNLYPYTNYRRLEKTTPRLNRWVVMHEFGHVFGLGHSYGTQSVMSYSSCPDEAQCTTQPSYDDVYGINQIYPQDWYEDGSGAGCSVVKTVDQAAPPGESSEAISLSETLMEWMYKATSLAGQSLGKPGLSSPIDGKLTFRPECR